MCVVRRLWVLERSVWHVRALALIRLLAAPGAASLASPPFGRDPSCTFQVRWRARPRSREPAVSRVSAPLYPGWQAFIDWSACHPVGVPNRGTGVACRASLRRRNPVPPTRVARVPPDFTAPAPCVGPPSGRRSCCALPCSAQPKSTGAFRTVRSVEVFATGGKR